VLRELAQVATGIAEEALSPVPQEIGRMLDEAESRIFGIAESTSRQGQGPQDLNRLLAQVYERVDHLHMQDNPNGVTGLPSGFVDLDQKTAGFQPGDLIIVAGRPSMGKTAFALNVAEYVALNEKVQLPVVVFSMEMSGAQLTSRLLASIGKIDSQRMRTGRLNEEEWGRLTDAMARMQDARISIDDSGALTAGEVRARARRLKRRFGKIGLVVVDYLQLMEAKTKGENRATEIAEITRSLKAMAKELDCPVMALSQLTRTIDTRTDKRPLMSDLRESGAIEQDADTILFLYREVVYDPDCDDERKALAEVIIGKQRNGPIGSVTLTFLGQYTRFSNYAGTASMDFAPRRTSRKKGATNFADA
jgi:replicative DNA helicase